MDREHRDSDAKEAIRDAADDIRRETRAAADELRIELGFAGRETRAALREAMAEVRDALSEVWPGADDSPTSSAGGRLSRAERKEMTRELLLDAAIDVFAERGYHGASLDDVAEAAGFTKGAVYSNFTRKSDLFRALLERESARRSQALRQIIDAVPLALLPDVAGELLRRPEADRAGQTLQVEFWLAAARDPSLRSSLMAGGPELGEVLERKLRDADAHPGLDGAELAMIFDALAFGLTMQRALDPDGPQAVAFTKALHKLIADLPPRGPAAEPATD